MTHDSHINTTNKQSNAFIDEKTFLSICAINFFAFDFTFYLVDLLSENGRFEFDAVNTPVVTLVVLCTFFLASIFHSPRITEGKEREFYWFVNIFLSISLIAVFVELFKVDMAIRFFIETFKMVFLSITLTRLFLYLPGLFFDINRIRKALLATAVVAAVFVLYLFVGGFVYDYYKNLY